MRGFVPRSPVVSCALLGVIAGVTCGLVEVVAQHAKYGFSDKVGALYKLTFAAGLSIGLFAFCGIVIGMIIGLAIASLRRLTQSTAHRGRVARP